MILIRILLFPLAVLFDGLTRLRNRLFDIGLKPSASFDIPVISVGNLSVGGTGKTPMVEYLIRLLLKKSYRIATLSRGYGRKTKGMRIAANNDTASTLGDEPFQMYQKFKDSSIISVGEERALAIPFLVDQFPALQTIILDDAFQHRAVTAGFSILLTDYSSPFFTDFLMPSGRLREARKGANRASVIVVTKCPYRLEEKAMEEIERRIHDYADKQVFFTTVTYGTPQPIQAGATPGKRVILVSGLANSKPLEQYVRSNFEMLKHYNLHDHHAYNRTEVAELISYARGHNAEILTTEKDWSKLQALLSEQEGSLFYLLPIEIDFLKNGSDFDTLILNYVHSVVAD